MKRKCSFELDLKALSFLPQKDPLLQVYQLLAKSYLKHICVQIWLFVQIYT